MEDKDVEVLDLGVNEAEFNIETPEEGKSEVTDNGENN